AGGPGRTRRGASSHRPATPDRERVARPRRCPHRNGPRRRRDLPPAAVDPGRSRQLRRRVGPHDRGWPALVFTPVLTAVTALLFGGAPALRASRADVANALRDSVGGTEGRPGTRLRRALVAGRIALALTLLVGAGLMVRSLIRLVEADPGFRADNVLTLEIALPRHEYASGEGIPDFQRRLMERVATLPGVRAAGMVNVLPMARSSPSV